MAKWVRYFFSIPLKDGKREVVSGPMYRGLAMLRIGTGVWSLTHVKTGHRIYKITGQKTEAYQLAESVANLINWDAYTDAAEIRKIPRLVERIEAVTEFFVADEEPEAGHA